MPTYPVGAFFVTKIGGSAGWWIGLGQALCGRPSRYAHAGIIVTTDGAIVEAEPGKDGARLAHISEYDPAGVFVCDAPVRQWAAANPGQPVGLKRQQVAAAAYGLLRRRYSILDYVALGLLHLHLPSRWVRHRVKSSGHLICSQLVVEALRRAGIDPFGPDTFCGDYMPSDLADLAEMWAERQEVAA